jgi:hypothetical protein
VTENARDDQRVLDRRDEAQTPATFARENVDCEDSAEKLGRGEIAAGGWRGAQCARRRVARVQRWVIVIVAAQPPVRLHVGQLR